MRFSPTNPNGLLVTSWDATTRYYDVTTNEHKCKFEHRTPVLACTFADANLAYSGGLDTFLHEYVTLHAPFEMFRSSIQ